MVNEVALPLEIIEDIAGDKHLTQKDLYAACLVSRVWYLGSIKFLYREPFIVSRNFQPFVRAICPSINAHIRHNGLAGLVVRLDMRNLVHDSSKSLTARLLGRVKDSLEEFVAPQASFAINCLAALSKCRHLRHLDLSAVSQTATLYELLRSIGKLEHLSVLILPRAASPPLQSRTADVQWPPNLRRAHLNATLREENLAILQQLPESLTHVYAEDLPTMSEVAALSQVLENPRRPLTYLHVRMRRARNRFHWLEVDVSLNPFLQLKHLYIDIELLLLHEFVYQSPPPSIVRLDLGTFGTEYDPRERAELLLELSNLIFADRMPRLRQLGITRDFQWRGEGQERSQLAEIDQLLKTLAREDGADAQIAERDAGVLILG